MTIRTLSTKRKPSDLHVKNKFTLFEEQILIFQQNNKYFPKWTTSQVRNVCNNKSLTTPHSCIFTYFSPIKYSTHSQNIQNLI